MRDLTDRSEGGGDAGGLSDNSSDTQVTFDTSSPRVEWRLAEGPEKVRMYTLTSGDGSPAEDPKSWVLKGSRDGRNWTVLDERSGESFKWRRHTRAFAERLGVRLTAEIAAGHSLIGPHRDDLEILADRREVARFGSAGQQRSALLLLDLAQVEIYNSVYEESPVLIIDDLDAELDRGRIEALLGELEGRAQTIISTSRRAIANRYRDRASVYLVESGRAERESEASFAGIGIDDGNESGNAL